MSSGAPADTPRGVDAPTAHLAPAPGGGRSTDGRPSRAPERADATTLLTLFLVLLFGLNAEQVIGPLGAIGNPATLIAFAAAAWWATGRIVPWFGLDLGRSPVRILLLVHAWYMLASYVVASTRPATPLEQTGAGRAALLTIGMTGIALLACDGIRDRDRLHVLSERIVLGCTFLAAIGIAQWATGLDLQLPVPGLTWNQVDNSVVGSRSVFNRPSGTALHPIEFSVITAALLPLALHHASVAPQGTRRNNAIARAAIIALAVPLSISRSGLVVLPIALLVVGLGWTWRQRAQAGLTMLAAIPFLWALVPGLVGTLIGLFTNTGEDVSIQARINRVPRIMAQIRERPWLGLGNGTWSVEDHFLVDNEFFITTMETGIIGAALTLVLLGAAVLLGMWIRYRPVVRTPDGQLGLALAAGVAGIGVSLFTFDTFFYRILTGTLFLLIGMIGALWRFSRPDVDAPTTSPGAT